VGRYPYPVALRGGKAAPPALELCQEHLRRLLQDERVSTFISMQAELPQVFAEGKSGGGAWFDPGTGASFSPYAHDASSFAAARGLSAPEFLHVSCVYGTRN